MSTAQQARPSRQESHKASSVEVLQASSSEEDSPGVKLAPESSYQESSGEPKQQPKASSRFGKDLSVKELLALSTSESSSSDDDDLPPLGVARAVNLKSKSLSKTKRDSGHGSSSLKTGERKKSSKSIKGSERGLGGKASPTPSATEKTREIPSTSRVDQKGDAVAVGEGGKKRYVLFVGNVPYAATKEDVVGHFEQRGAPVMDVRLATSKETGKSRGFCFVEFGSPKALQVCA